MYSSHYPIDCLPQQPATHSTLYVGTCWRDLMVNEQISLVAVNILSSISSFPMKEMLRFSSLCQVPFFLKK